MGVGKGREDPAVDLCLRTYGDPKGVGVSYERGTPVDLWDACGAIEAAPSSSLLLASLELSDTKVYEPQIGALL